MSLEILNTTDSDIFKIKIGALTSGNNGAMMMMDETQKNVFKIPASEDLTGIELRIKSIYIKDNRTPSFGPFPGNANFYLLNIVTSDVPNQRIEPVSIATFPRIGDEESLPCKDTLFYFQQENEDMKCPNQLHVITSVIKCKKDLRSVGDIMSDLKKDNMYTDLVTQLVNIGSDATPVGVVAGIVRELGGIVGNYLGKVEDRPLGTIMRSFTSIGGDWDVLGVNPIQMHTKYINFNFDLIVRNNGKEKALAKSLNLNIKNFNV